MFVFQIPTVVKKVVKNVYNETNMCEVTVIYIDGSWAIIV